jgi:hypothetical protein
VSHDLSACAEVVFATPQAIAAGQFSAIGVLSDEDRTVLVHKVTPISWSNEPTTQVGLCSPAPGLSPPMTGSVEFLIEVHAVSGDYVSGKVCHAFGDLMTCLPHD